MEATLRAELLVRLLDLLRPLLFFQRVFVSETIRAPLARVLRTPGCLVDLISEAMDASLGHEIFFQRVSQDWFDREQLVSKPSERGFSPSKKVFAGAISESPGPP